MARSFPPDVIVLDHESLIHARLDRGRKNPQITHAKSYRIAADTFRDSVVTPAVDNEAGLAESLRRLRMESGKWDRVSVLLPDSWFRMNILDLPALPEKRQEAIEVVRWTLKRTLPVAPEELRISWEILSRASGSVKVLVVAAMEKTLATIERVCAAAGCEVVLIEPLGLNIWNAVAVREPDSEGDRLFLYIRRHDFTTAVFRGGQPVFLRSRNLSGDRTVLQEMKLSANYLRDTFRSTSITQCIVAGNSIDRDLAAVIGEEFGAPVKLVSLGDVAERAPLEAAAFEAELTACTGVFTA
jgi:type IV pilus assembly protein PilM